MTSDSYGSQDTQTHTFLLYRFTPRPRPTGSAYLFCFVPPLNRSYIDQIRRRGYSALRAASQFPGVSYVCVGLFFFKRERLARARRWYVGQRLSTSSIHKRVSSCFGLCALRDSGRAEKVTSEGHLSVCRFITARGTNVLDPSRQQILHRRRHPWMNCLTDESVFQPIESSPGSCWGKTGLDRERAKSRWERLFWLVVSEPTINLAALPAEQKIQKRCASPQRPLTRLCLDTGGHRQ